MQRTPRIEIEYSAQCRWLLRARGSTADAVAKWNNNLVLELDTPFEEELERERRALGALFASIAKNSC
jgi:predicted Rdx family selenoprotein